MREEPVCSKITPVQHPEQEPSEAKNLFQGKTASAVIVSS